MIRGRILVIEGDEWGAGTLLRELQDKGFETDLCESAVAGYKRACETVPDCIVCSVTLPDIDGFWVARRVRTEASAAAATPFLMLVELGDRQARIQALRVGADIVVEKPISNEEIVAQVEALVEMARRLRPPVEGTEENARPSLAAAFRGDLSAFPLASILMMLEMERRTGTLEVVSTDDRRAILVLSTGLFANTEVEGEARAPIEVLREVLSWRAGRFAFRPREVASLPPPRGSVGALVLEAMRLEDEHKNAS